MGTLKIHFRIFCGLLLVFSFLSPSCFGAVQRASIVMCAETGKIYHQQNADAITHPASLTKMMTLYLTFKALREKKLTLNETLAVSKHATQVEPSKLGLREGSTIAVRQAILALVTKSANDASVVLAEALGNGSEALFAAKMTRQARLLGMSKTIFKNAHGLPNKAQVTTARDMAILSRRLYKDFPEYFHVFKTQKFVYKGQVHPNHNRLLGKVQGLDGIKTGFINASGFNLAASVIRNNRRIIAVVMGGESANLRNKKMVKLLEATYATLTKRNVFPKNQPSSIGDLICSLEPSPPQPGKAKLHKAVIRGQCRPAKVMTTKYSVMDSMEDLLDASLDDIDEAPKNIKKSPPSPKKPKNTKKLSKKIKCKRKIVLKQGFKKKQKKSKRRMASLT